MPPSQKKRKTRDRRSEPDTEEGGPLPTIFISPGLQPDTRLRVFDQEFHVHSVILKLHSNFFRRFLDSPEKPEPAPSAKFRYDYISVLDEDDVWGLEPVATADPRRLAVGWMDAYDLIGYNQNEEVEVFGMLLKAMYNRPYRVESLAQLTILTRQADFYCALPIVSATLTGALVGSPLFSGEDADVWIDKSPLIMNLARKLRHALLFREAFVHTVANWHDAVACQNKSVANLQWKGNVLKRIEPVTTDEVFSRLVTTEYINNCTKVMEAHQNIFAIVMDPSHYGQIAYTIEKEEVSGTNAMDGAGMHVTLLAKFRSSHIFEHVVLVASLRATLQNNLILDHSGDGPGVGVHVNQFLCAQISDEDIPWDADEVDW